MVVDSEPVPAVVGTAMRGLTGSQGRLARADRRRDEVEQLTGVGGQQVDRLGGVHGRSAADRDEAVPVLFAGPCHRLVDALVGGLDGHPVEHLGLDARGDELSVDPVGHPGVPDAGVGDHQA